MNCPKCGSQLADGASFCPVCGSKVDTGGQQPPVPENIPVQGYSEAQREEKKENRQSYDQQRYYYGQGYQQDYGQSYQMPDDPTRPLNFYYQRQFAAIAEGERGSFNWAAFFLGPYHAIYRGHTKRFLALYLPLILVVVIDEIGMIAALGAGHLMLTGVFMILSWVVALAALGISIYNGFTFNRSYYAVCGGDPHVPHHGGRLAAVIVVMVVAIAVLTAAFVGVFAQQVITQLKNSGTLGNQTPYSDSVPFDDFLPQEDPNTSSQGQTQQGGSGFGSVDELLAAYSTVSSDQLYLLGWGDPDAADEQSMIESVYLFSADDSSLLDTLGAASRSIFWETFEPTEELFQGEAYYYTIYCSLDEGEVAFDVVAGGGNAAVFGCYVWQGEEYIGLDQQQASALLAALYDRAGASQSLASRARGSWRTSDGKEFVLDATTLNGQPYTLWYVSDGVLAVYLDETTDVSGEYYMMFNGNVLNVWQYDESNTIINDLYYTRVN